MKKVVAAVSAAVAVAGIGTLTTMVLGNKEKDALVEQRYKVLWKAAETEQDKKIVKKIYIVEKKLAECELQRVGRYSSRLDKRCDKLNAQFEQMIEELSEDLKKKNEGV